jgi:aminoglycoside phosphotransferase (APT) family kinase protein
MSEPLRGLETDPVTRWIREHVEGAEGTLRFELVAAGGSNLTYRIFGEAGRRWVLRRPPERARIATAHEMGREWKILSALHAHPESGIPVPEAVAYCDDPSVTGAEFYVMGFADGLILRGPEDAAPLDAAACSRAADSLIDVQIAMARVDPDAVGLGDLGRREAYVERPLARWLRQFEASDGDQTPGASRIRALHARLGSDIPDQQTCGLVHGDYRFDNTVLGPDQRIIAVLDWELCTLGDPVADFVWSVMYWTDPEEERDFGALSPTRHPAFPRRSEAIRRYADRSGLDLSRLAYYQIFSGWKMACLLTGVTARLRAGASGGLGGSADVGPVFERIDWMLGDAERLAAKL